MLGLSQSQAAKAWDVPLPTLKTWEGSTRTPRGMALRMLLEKLDAILAAPAEGKAGGKGAKGEVTLDASTAATLDRGIERFERIANKSGRTVGEVTNAAFKLAMRQMDGEPTPSPAKSPQARRDTLQAEAPGIGAPRLRPEHIEAFTTAAAVFGCPAQDLVVRLVGWLTAELLSPCGSLLYDELTNWDYPTPADREAAVDRFIVFLKSRGASTKTIIILTGPGKSKRAA